MKHGELIEEMKRAAADYGSRLFKNASGLARHKDERGKVWVVKYGVGPSNGGGHDLLGWREVVITPEMVGMTIAQFISFDGKVGDDELSDEQIKWMTWVINGGGIACEIRNIEQLAEILGAPWRTETRDGLISALEKYRMRLGRKPNARASKSSKGRAKG
jgi:hypothetical protein